MRQAQVNALCCNQQLDAENGGEVVRHIAHPARGVRRHRDMIFLVRTGRRRIDRAGSGALLVLGVECGGRHLGDHEAGVEAGIGREKRRQAEIQRGVDQSAMRRSLIAPISGKPGDLVRGKGDRLSVEIAARDDLSTVRQDQRIVGDGIGFDRSGYVRPAPAHREHAPMTCGWQRRQ